MSKTIPVKLPSFNNVPRWLIIQGEMDYRLFILEKMLKRDRAPIVQMIDKATGFDKQLETEALELIAECRWLKQEYDAEVTTAASTSSKPTQTREKRPKKHNKGDKA